MPNTREKLIELLEDRRLEASEVCGSMNNGFGAWYADHLIANGVTIKKPTKPKKRGISQKAMIALNLIGEQTHREGKE